jgi:AcrR family transcriptional regulator
MTTIYRRYPTREALIAGALRWWMDENRYAGVAESAAGHLSGSVYDDLMALFRTIFQPWEQHPHMLRAYFRAQAGPGGQGLIEHGLDVVVPVAKEILQQADPTFAKDMEMVLSGVIYGLLGQFADGAIAVTDILPALDRAVFWLTASQEVTKDVL